MDCGRVGAESDNINMYSKLLITMHCVPHLHLHYFVQLLQQVSEVLASH